MGCNPSRKEEEIIIEIKNERGPSNRGTVSSCREPTTNQEYFNQINVTLFIIGEENSKYEESGMPSHLGTLLTPQLTDTNKD